MANRSKVTRFEALIAWEQHFPFRIPVEVDVQSFFMDTTKSSFIRKVVTHLDNILVACGQPSVVRSSMMTEIEGDAKAWRNHIRVDLNGKGYGIRRKHIATASDFVRMLSFEVGLCPQLIALREIADDKAVESIGEQCQCERTAEEGDAAM